MQIKPSSKCTVAAQPAGGWLVISTEENRHSITITPQLARDLASQLGQLADLADPLGKEPAPASASAFIQ